MEAQMKKKNKIKGFDQLGGCTHDYSWFVYLNLFTVNIIIFS